MVAYPRIQSPVLDFFFLNPEILNPIRLPNNEIEEWEVIPKSLQFSYQFTTQMEKESEIQLHWQKDNLVMSFLANIRNQTGLKSNPFNYGYNKWLNN